MTSFYDCTKCKTCCHVLTIPFKDQNRQLCCLAATVHIVLQERRVAITIKIPSPFLKDIFRQSVSRKSEPAPRKG